uniref:G_PROTEIN_RECEP_F1_2 domain-containing protein n=1 Tax=Steinernema glaseri TaxID=37863 RepID=A0A1I8AGV6_9BILA
MATDTGVMEEPPHHPINDIVVLYPPTEDPSPQTLANTVVLLACFTAGIAGNTSQLALQLYTNRFSMSRKMEHSQYYIALLHIVYFFISIALPSIIIENLVKMWMFGMVTCASHFILVTSGRAVIGWILVFIVVDQIIFSDFWKCLNRINLRRVFYASLVFLAVFAILIVAPSLLYIKIIVYDEYTHISNFRIETYSCSTLLPKQVSFYSNSFALAFDYIIPILLVIVLFTIYLGKASKRRSHSSYSHQWKINAYIVLLTFFHFLAYLPHWTAILLLFVAENWSIHIPDWVLVVLQQLVLLLPHLTAALAWLPLSNLSALLADRSRRLYNESYNRLLRPRRQNTWMETSGF